MYKEHELLNKHLENMVVSYHNNHMFIPVLKDIRSKFLVLTNQETITYVSFTVLCLLIVQAISKMVDGYNGNSTSSENILYEAVGLSYRPYGGYKITDRKGRYPISDVYAAPFCDRYDSVTRLILKLMKEDKNFSDVVDNFLAWDLHNPKKS